MGSLGVTELLLILLIVVLIFGARRLPELGAGIGSAIRNFRGAMRDGHQEDQGSGDKSTKNNGASPR